MSQTNHTDPIEPGVLDLVAYDVQCRMTGEVLDARTCLVIRDADGSPLIVMDPSVVDDEELKQSIAKQGWTLDTRKTER